ncbi:hypothetical protein [Antribacter gilvus]|uniref:hypothetical protein n=1 Tax=Antribacter gilvus TaxID=2304675 RepID=UPI000F76EDB6|nr:hypothetical protein [Antribacter gilvus]
MPTFSAVTRDHVLTALTEYDKVGPEQFLSDHGFGPSREYVIWHDGRSYDSKAILGVAHGFATGTPAHSEEFGIGRTGTAPILEALGFDVRAEILDAKAALPAGTAVPARTVKAPAKRAAVKREVVKRKVVQERPVIICPGCFQQLPAMGNCDNCA